MFHMSAILATDRRVRRRRHVPVDDPLRALAALEMLAAERATSVLDVPGDHAGAAQPPRFPPGPLAASGSSTTSRRPTRCAGCRRRMPTVQISSYGLTECGGVVSFNDPADTLEQRTDHERERRSDGIEVGIRDLETGAARPGEPGEIVVRGYCVFDGYYGDPGRRPRRRRRGLVPHRRHRRDRRRRAGSATSAASRTCSRSAARTSRRRNRVLPRRPTRRSASSRSSAFPDPKYVEVPAAFVELAPGAAHRGGADRVLPRRIATFKVPRHIRFVRSGRCRRRRSRSSASSSSSPRSCRRPDSSPPPDPRRPAARWPPAPPPPRDAQNERSSPRFCAMMLRTISLVTGPIWYSRTSRQ